MESLREAGVTRVDAHRPQAPMPIRDVAAPAIAPDRAPVAVEDLALNAYKVTPIL